MLKATVTGSVWATRRIDSIPRGAFLEVLTDDGARLVAFDVLGSGVGERVLVTTGSVASAWFGAAHPPVDALIIGSLDPERETEPPPPPPPTRAATRKRPTPIRSQSTRAQKSTKETGK
ncbi:MAG TPA: EutN/CcmL family microcompartment protein [Solirubrobacteraceae bacterium]|nr:EutN/CcmL family microcompartment protein [Solirubrobacteraceae bacterium]